jgi:hypothetical protein
MFLEVAPPGADIAQNILLALLSNIKEASKLADAHIHNFFIADKINSKSNHPLKRLPLGAESFSRKRYRHTFGPRF